MSKKIESCLLSGKFLVEKARSPFFRQKGPEKGTFDSAGGKSPSERDFSPFKGNFGAEEAMFPVFWGFGTGCPGPGCGGESPYGNKPIRKAVSGESLSVKTGISG